MMSLCTSFDNGCYQPHAEMPRNPRKTMCCASSAQRNCNEHAAEKDCVAQRSINRLIKESAAAVTRAAPRTGTCAKT